MWLVHVSHDSRVIVFLHQFRTHIRTNTIFFLFFYLFFVNISVLYVWQARTIGWDHRKSNGCEVCLSVWSSAWRYCDILESGSKIYFIHFILFEFFVRSLLIWNTLTHPYWNPLSLAPSLPFSLSLLLVLSHTNTLFPPPSSLPLT